MKLPQAINKPTLKQTSQSNQNSASTLINTLDTKSTQKVNLKSLEKNQIQLNHQNMNQHIDMNAITDFSKKSSPHTKHISDIPSSKLSTLNNPPINKGVKPNSGSNPVSINLPPQKNNSKSPRLDEKVDLIKIVEQHTIQRFKKSCVQHS